MLCTQQKDLMTSRSNQPATLRVVQPVGLSIYPTLDSLQQVYDLADSSLPILTKNSLRALLGVFHNTLLKQLSH